MNVSLTPSSELKRKILEIAEGGITQLKFYLDTIDATTASRLLESLPATTKDTSDYKVYTYNNPWRGKVIFKTEFWREWLNNNPIYAGLFLETVLEEDPKTGKMISKEIVAMPSLGEKSIAPPPLEIGGGLPKDSDWQTFFLQVQLEITKLRDNNKDLENQLTNLQQKDKLKDKLHHDAIRSKNEQIGELSKNLVEEQAKIIKLVNSLIDTKGELSEETKKFKKVIEELRESLQKETATKLKVEKLLRDKEDEHNSYLSQKEIELLQKTQEIDQLKLALSDKTDKSELIEEQEKTIAKLKKEYQEKLEKLEQNVRGKNQNIDYLEQEASKFISRIVDESDLVGIKAGLARMEMVFSSIGLINTWEFVKEGYQQLIEIQEVYNDTTTEPIDEETEKFKIIKERLIHLLEEINWTIPVENWESQQAFRLIVNKLKDNSVSRTSLFSDVQSFLVERPNLLVKEGDILAWLNLWESLEKVSPTIPVKVESTKPFWEIPEVPVEKTDFIPSDLDYISPDIFKSDLELLEEEINNYVEYSSFAVSPFNWSAIAKKLESIRKPNWEKEIKKIIQKTKDKTSVLYDEERVNEVIDNLSKILAGISLDADLDKSWLTIDNVAHILKNIRIKVKYTKEDWIKEIENQQANLEVASEKLEEGVYWKSKLKNKNNWEVADYAKEILRDIYRKNGKEQQIPDDLKDPFFTSFKSKLTQWQEEISEEFTEELVDKWESLGIDKEQAKKWLGDKTKFPQTSGLIVFGKKINDDRLVPSDFVFVGWLIEEKGKLSADYANPQWYRSQILGDYLSNFYQEWEELKYNTEPKTFYFSPFISDEYYEDVLQDAGSRNLKIYQSGSEMVLDDKHAYINCQGSYHGTYLRNKKVEEGILVVKNKCLNAGGWEEAKKIILKYPFNEENKLQLETTKVVWVDKEVGGIDVSDDYETLFEPAASQIKEEVCLLVAEDFKIIEVDISTHINLDEEKDFSKNRQESKKQKEEEKSWTDFFREKTITNKESWKNLGLEKANTVWNNGWTNLSEYTINEKTKEVIVPTYTSKGETDFNLNAAVISKTELINAHGLFYEIKQIQTFKELDEWKEDNQERIDVLQDDKLPATTFLEDESGEIKVGRQKQDVENFIISCRASLKYRLNVENNEKEGDGLGDKLKEAWTSLKNEFPATNYNPVTPELLNKILAIDESGEWSSTPNEQNFLEILKSKNIKHFKVDENITQQEKAWGNKSSPDFAPWKKGSLQFPYFFKKIGNWDESNLDNRLDDWSPDDPQFCKWGKKTIKVKRSSVKGKPKKASDWEEKTIEGILDKCGHLAIATGVGKTTMLVNCLLAGGENDKLFPDYNEVTKAKRSKWVKDNREVEDHGWNIVLVTPTQAMAAETADNHHKAWLQNWGCVYHKIIDPNTKEYKSHGGYPVTLNELCYSYNQDSETYEGNKGLSVLYWPYLFGYLARAKCDINTIREGTKGRDKSSPWINPQTGKEEWIKEKLIPKKNTIIIFDEAHCSGDYQTLIDMTIKDGYKVLKMSATFPKMEFSIDSSFPRTISYTDGFLPQMNKERWENLPVDDIGKGNTLVFISDIEEFKTKFEADLKKAGVCYVFLDETLQDSARDISFAVENALIFGDDTFEMCFTFKIKRVIILGWKQNIILRGDWVYEKKDPSNITWASFIQKWGRIGRFMSGWGYILIDDCEAEPTRTITLGSAVIKACLGKKNKEKSKSDTTDIENTNSSLKDPELLRNALGLPGELFGKEPEVILVGLKTTDHIVGQTKDKRTKNIYDIVFNSFSATGGKRDENLVKRHTGEWTPRSVDKEQSRKILRDMITFWVSNQKEFPDKLEINESLPLIENSGITSEEVKMILNGIVKKELVKVHEEAKIAYNQNNVEYDSDKKDVFAKVVALLRFSLEVNIAVEGKELKISYSGQKKKKKTVKQLIKKRDWQSFYDWLQVNIVDKDDKKQKYGNIKESRRKDFPRLATIKTCVLSIWLNHLEFTLEREIINYGDFWLPKKDLVALSTYSESKTTREFITFESEIFLWTVDSTLLAELDKLLAEWRANTPLTTIEEVEEDNNEE